MVPFKMNRVRQAILGLFFPPLCLHCEEKTDGALLCASCSELLQLLDRTGRCPKCADYCKGKCLKLCLPYKELVVAMENEGPIRSLVRQLENGKLPGIARTLSSYLVVQWLKNNLDVPDCIVPFRRSKWEKMRRGYSPAELLAKELQRQLGVGKGTVAGKRVVVVDTVLTSEGLAKFATELQMEMPAEVWGLCVYSLKSISGISYTTSGRSASDFW